MRCDEMNVWGWFCRLFFGVLPREAVGFLFKVFNEAHFSYAIAGSANFFFI